MRIAILRDPVARSKPGETTHFLAREALRRGYEVWVFTADQLRWDEGVVRARASTISYAGPDAATGPIEDVDLATMDVVLVRHDPPADLAWQCPLWILDHLPPHVVVANSLAALRSLPDKLGILGFAEAIPPTLITADPATLREFRERHAAIVIKPLFDKGSAGVFVFAPDDHNFDVVLDSWLPRIGHPVMAQAWVPEASEGPVRVMVIAGRIVGALRAVPRSGHRRVSMDSAREVIAHSLDEAQLRTVTRVAAELGHRGVMMAGLDLVGDRLIELNLTSPGGEVYYDRVYPTPLAVSFWDAMEAQRSAIGATMSSVETAVSSSRTSAPANRPLTINAHTIG